MNQFFLWLAALALTAVLIRILSPLARRIGLVDEPGGRKVHEGAVPLIGGISLFVTFFLLILLVDTPLYGWRSLFFAAALVFIIGMLDDFKETPASARFVAQMGAVLIIVFWGGLKLEYLGDLLGSHPIHFSHMVVPFTLLGGVGVMNAVNMLDGLDGLAGGVLLVFFTALWWLAHTAGLSADATVLGVICASLMGFLWFNMRILGRSRASVFMGDAGSLFLGLLATWFLIRMTQPPLEVMRPITAVWLLGLPIMDTVAIMIRRIRQGRSPFSPDREHFHHILLVAGFSVRTTVFIILTLHSCLVLLGLTGEWLKLPEYIMFYSFLLLFFLYFWGMNHAWKVMKMLRKVHDAGVQPETQRTNVNV